MSDTIKLTSMAISIVESYTRDGEQDGYAIKVNGSKGYGSIYICEDDNGDDLIVVNSIFGDFEWDKNMYELEEFLAQRAAFILDAFI